MFLINCSYGNWMIVWTQFDSVSQVQQIVYSTSVNGEEWEPAEIVFDHTEYTRWSFPVLASGNENEFVIAAINFDSGYTGPVQVREWKGPKSPKITTKQSSNNVIFIAVGVTVGGVIVI